MPKISIIIVNYNGERFILSCLDSLLKKQKNIDLEIIMVDNNSKDDSVRKVKEKYSQIKIIKNKEDVGFGRACNQGTKIAKADILFFLTPDTIIINDQFFNKAINAFKEPLVGVVGFKIFSLENKRQLWTHGQKKNDIIWVSGAALMIRKSVFKKVNGFDEKFFLYFEDRDLCQRVIKNGYKIKLLNEKIIHSGGTSFSDKKEQKKYYYQSQSYFWQKHYGLIASLLLRLIRWPYKKIKLFLT